MQVKSEYLKEAFFNAFKRDLQYQTLCAAAGTVLAVDVYDEFEFTGTNDDGTVVFQATVLFEGREFAAAIAFYAKALPIELQNAIGIKVNTKELLSSVFNSVVKKSF